MDIQIFELDPKKLKILEQMVEMNRMIVEALCVPPHIIDEAVASSDDIIDEIITGAASVVHTVTINSERELRELWLRHELPDGTKVGDTVRIRVKKKFEVVG